MLSYFAIDEWLTHWPLENLNQILHKFISVIDGWSEIALRWLSWDLSDYKSTLVQVRAWCRQATSHCLSQCWPSSMLPYLYGITRSQWDNFNYDGDGYSSQIQHWGWLAFCKKISKYIFLNENSLILIWISLKFHPQGSNWLCQQWFR